MAETGVTGRGGLGSAFGNLIPNNTNQEISEQDVRDVLNSLKDSNFNITDDDAFRIQYPQTTSDDWGVGSTNVGDSLDILAKGSEVLNFYANTDNTVSNIIVLHDEGVILNNSEEINGTRLSTVTYQKSADNETWSLVDDGTPANDGTFGALQSDVSDMNPGDTLYIRAIFTFQAAKFGEELVTIKYRKL